MSTLSRADSSQMAEERIMEEQQKGRSNKKTKKKKKGTAAFQLSLSAHATISLLEHVNLMVILLVCSLMQTASVQANFRSYS